MLFGSLKLRCDERFTHAFTACGCVFKEIALVGSNQGNFFENATNCSKRKLKTTVATQLKLFNLNDIVKTVKKCNLLKICKNFMSLLAVYLRSCFLN